MTFHSVFGRTSMLVVTRKLGIRALNTAMRPLSMAATQQQRVRATIEPMRERRRQFSSEDGGVSGDGTAFASEADYHAIADQSLEDIQDLLDSLEDSEAMEDDDVDISYSQGVLNINLGKAGFWVLNKQTPNRQIWWSSPVSGPKRYEYTDGEWVCSRVPDGPTLSQAIAEEVSAATGVSLL